MKIRLYRSDDGDCLLVEGSESTKILVDGGRKSSFRDHVMPAISGLDFIDLICISHIDRDHVHGILALMENIIDWRVFDAGHARRQPVLAKPPPVGEIWHNAFHETVRENRGAIERFLGQSASVLVGHREESIRNIGLQLGELTDSVGDGIELSRRISPEQLNIPLNEIWNGKLITRLRKDEFVELGELAIDILGPTAKELRELREFWNDWLRNTQAELARIRARAIRDEERLNQSMTTILLEAAEELAQELGERSRVTEPNLASIMLFVEDADGTTALLNGDGHADDIEAGLKHCDRLENDHLHMNLMKIAHHGSEFNSSLDHYRILSADHYVFCGNGNHENPDPRIIDAVIDSRLDATATSSDVTPATDFKLWFNSDPDDPNNSHSPHMQHLLQHVGTRAANSGGRMAFEFMTGSQRTISL